MGRGSIVKYGETTFGGSGLLKIPDNIWCMFDWILKQNCRDAHTFHK